jgi:hypothetical protein
MPTNPNQKDGDTLNPNPQPHGHQGPRDSENPGYETSDINVNGVLVFLSGLVGFVLVFFGLCFVLGRGINSGLQAGYVAEYGPKSRWHEMSSFAGAAANDGKRQDLASNPEMEQQSLKEMTSSFPSPRLDIDDGNQATADLHAREDLLLDHYSVSAGQNGTIRIPIARAMELIAQRGLPVAPARAAASQMAGDVAPVVQAPLTSGFARTGYELATMEARKQKIEFGSAETAEKK